MPVVFSQIHFFRKLYQYTTLGMVSRFALLVHGGLAETFPSFQPPACIGSEITNGVLKSSVTDVRVGLHPSKGGKGGGFFWTRDRRETSVTSKMALFLTGVGSRLLSFHGSVPSFHSLTPVRVELGVLCLSKRSSLLRNLLPGRKRGHLHARIEFFKGPFSDFFNRLRRNLRQLIRNTRTQISSQNSVFTQCTFLKEVYSYILHMAIQQR